MATNRFFVGITDERWLHYHYQHNSQKVNFWGVHNKGVNLYKEFYKHLFEIGGREHLKDNPFIFIFKTKVDYKFIDKLCPMDSNSLYGWAKIVDVDEPNLWNENNPNNPLPFYNIHSLWNKYGKMNGTDNIAELHTYLNKVNDWKYLSNVILEDVRFFNQPIEADWWLKKYGPIQRGKIFYLTNKQPPINGSVIDKNTSDEEIANYIYYTLKQESPSFGFKNDCHS